MEWLFLALISAFALASADALTKARFGTYTGFELVLLRVAAPAVVLAPLLAVHPLPPVPPAFWGWVALLVPLELGAMLLYVVAIRDCPLHLTLPYLSFTPVLNVATGYLILGETVSSRGLAGILMVVVGAWVLNAEHARADDGLRGLLAPFAAVARERGARMMLAVAAIYSLTSVLGKKAMSFATPESFGPFYFVTVGVVALVVFALVRPATLGVLTRPPKWHLVLGLLMGAMIITHFMALARVEVAYMITVKRTSLLFGILYGALLFRERRLGPNLIAGGLMVAGIGLILL